MIKLLRLINEFRCDTLYFGCVFPILFALLEYEPARKFVYGYCVLKTFNKFICYLFSGEAKYVNKNTVKKHNNLVEIFRDKKLRICVTSYGVVVIEEDGVYYQLSGTWAESFDMYLQLFTLFLFLNIFHKPE